ncbi:MAG: hypothetical protein KBH41_16400 [Azonexus sp.]|nr:hypothetical protein [Azonexus sp.]
MGNERGQALPASALDLKFVKVWYQNGNAWWSYFGDSGVRLCPELLVNDEDLIRVDTEKKANYARLVEPDGRRHEHSAIAAPRCRAVRIISRQPAHVREPIGVGVLLF